MAEHVDEVRLPPVVVDRLPRLGETWDNATMAGKSEAVKRKYLEMLIRRVVVSFDMDPESTHAQQLIDTVAIRMIKVKYLDRDSFSWVSEDFEDTLQQIRRRNASSKDGV